MDDDLNLQDTSPADPAALADLCVEGGFPSMIAPLLQQKATLAQVRTKIEEAKATQLMARDMGFPEVGARLVAAGVPFAQARAILETAKTELEA